MANKIQAIRRKRKKNLKHDVVNRDKSLISLENENYDMKQLNEELESKIKELNIKFENKLNIIEELKNQNNEIINEFNKKIAEFEEFEKEKTKEFDVNNKKMKENYEEKVSYENIELKRDLELANKKINELKEYIVEKGKKQRR